MRQLIIIFCSIMVLNSCTILGKQKTNQAIFIDDFSNGLSTDWTVENHTFENNLAQFSTTNAKVLDGALQLQLTASKNNGKDFTGAEVRSKTKYLYGRFEARIKATQTLGCITAFFLYQTDGKNQEIDFEISGKFPNAVTVNHWIDKRSHDQEIPLPFNTTLAFHDYRMDWEPGKITWTVDNKIVYVTTEAVPNKAMQVIFNLWATKSIKWAGTINAAKLPATAYIDEVKFYPYKK